MNEKIYIFLGWFVGVCGAGASAAGGAEEVNQSHNAELLFLILSRDRLSE